MSLTNELLSQQVPLGEDLGGTDGFRGVFTSLPGPGLMNAETVAGLTYATIAHLQETEGISDGPVVVAQDSRPYGDELRSAAIAAAEAGGVRIVDLGVAPTPAAQKIASELGAMATFVLTASHNPASDNGLKYMTGWRKPGKDQVRVISERYWTQQVNGLMVPLMPKHELPVRTDLLVEYEQAVVDDIREAFGDDMPLAGKLFVVDGANGAAMNLTPSVFRQLGAQVETFACDGEGLINDGCGAAKLQGVKEFLLEHPELTNRADFVGSVSNDGDADRIMAVGIDEIGKLVEINGNHMLWALATNPMQSGIVGTEYTNSGLRKKLAENGIEFDECANGDVYVTQTLLKRQTQGDNWTRGGEFTGHIVDTAWLDSGDGVHKAAWLAAWAATNGLTFGDLYSALPLWSEEMRWVDFKDSGRKFIKQHPLVVAELNDIQAGASGEARFILRPSGTEPGVRIWGESGNSQLIGGALGRLAEVVTAIAAQ